MSTTPRTDARELGISIQNEDSCCAIYVKVYGKEYEGGLVDTDFARDLERENAELRKDKARLRETLAEIGEYRGEGGPATPWQDIVRDLGQMARAAIAAAMEGNK